MMDQGPMGPMGPTGPFGNSVYGNQLYVFLALILLIVVIVSIYILWINRRHDPKLVEYSEDSSKPDDSDNFDNNGYEDKLEVTMRLLNDNEKDVVEAIVAKGGCMLQKDITYDLGYSRVKTHRVLQGLAKRDIVTLEEYHNTNKVTLADWLISKS